MGNNLGSEKREVPIEEIFREACYEGRVEDVKSIIISRLKAGEDVIGLVNKTNRFDVTNLMIAASKEHSAVVKALLESNADPSPTDDKGNNALHYAALNETTTTIVKLLLNNMKLEDINRINNKDWGGITPLDQCYKWNPSSIKKQIIKLIRQKGGKRKSELEEAAGKGKGYKWWGGVNSRYNARELKF